MLASVLWSSSLLVLVACGPGSLDGDPDPGLEGLTLTSVAPAEVLPGSKLVVRGRSFVDDKFGAGVLHLSGKMDGADVDARLPLVFVDFGRFEHAFEGGVAAGLPADSGTFTGEATVEIKSKVTNQTHTSAPIDVTVKVARELVPRLDSVSGGPVIFVNEPMRVAAAGMLLGGAEGETFAEVAGCYQLLGAQACTTLTTARVPVVPASAFDRTRGTFAFDPQIAGIKPGTFKGTIKLVNDRAVPTSSQTVAAELTLTEPAIFSVSPDAASLGQYVNVEGGGFIAPERPGEPLSTTTIELDGSFTPAGQSTPVADVRLEVTPEFVTGPKVRYVLNEQDALGSRIDLRHAAGSFRGTARPVITRGADVVRGDATAIDFDIAPVKQVVWLRFETGYVESLRKFGLRAVDSLIRARILEVARRDYAGVNIEFRTEQPTDFKLYSTLDISGPDLNGLGYFGYDNTPGKDVGNERLYDHIGGLNATVLEDGKPGYGGVFVESLFAFSKHPNGLAKPVEGASPLFDELFDPFRPDLGGEAVLARDLTSPLPPRTSGQGCPARTRTEQISCAIFVLGSLIGTTMTHEVGHSLGLAAPDGDPGQFHDVGDAPNRLMDGGGARTFNERAELMSEGPSLFCDDEYLYLREILPSSASPTTVTRPRCK